MVCALLAQFLSYTPSGYNVIIILRETFEEQKSWVYFKLKKMKADETSVERESNCIHKHYALVQ